MLKVKKFHHLSEMEHFKEQTIGLVGIEFVQKGTIFLRVISEFHCVLFAFEIQIIPTFDFSGVLF
jgi:hypothetical protein